MTGHNADDIAETVIMNSKLNMTYYLALTTMLYIIPCNHSLFTNMVHHD